MHDIEWELVRYFCCAKGYCYFKLTNDLLSHTYLSIRELETISVELNTLSGFMYWKAGGYLWVCLTCESEGQRQASWIVVVTDVSGRVWGEGKVVVVYVKVSLAYYVLIVCEPLCDSIVQILTTCSVLECVAIHLGEDQIGTALGVGWLDD